MNTQDFYKILSEADTPEDAYAGLGALADHLVGAKLFTLLTFDPQVGMARRFYSNMPDAYPVSGTKPVPTNDWGEKVLMRGETFAGNDIETLAAVFPDYALIQSLGCESCLNVPVIVTGDVYGTINCLHVAGHYTPDRVAASEALKLPGAACFLLTHLVSRSA
ncbi:MAG: GAF domain-containing protein [Pseudomonadota bacterium]